MDFIDPTTWQKLFSGRKNICICGLPVSSSCVDSRQPWHLTQLVIGAEMCIIFTCTPPTKWFWGTKTLLSCEKNMLYAYKWLCVKLAVSKLCVEMHCEYQVERYRTHCNFSLGELLDAKLVCLLIVQTNCPVVWTSTHVCINIHVPISHSYSLIR